MTAKKVRYLLHEKGRCSLGLGMRLFSMRARSSNFGKGAAVLAIAVQCLVQSKDIKWSIVER